MDFPLCLLQFVIPKRFFAVASHWHLGRKAIISKLYDKQEQLFVSECINILTVFNTTRMKCASYGKNSLLLNGS